MHCRFKSKATGDLILMGEIGDSILRIIGKTPSEKGILQAAALPAAISAIQSAIALAESEPEHSVAEATDSGPDEVGLRRHAWPLLEMMKSAHSSDEAIAWGV